MQKRYIKNIKTLKYIILILIIFGFSNICYATLNEKKEKSFNDIRYLEIEGKNADEYQEEGINNNWKTYIEIDENRNIEKIDELEIKEPERTKRRYIIYGLIAFLIILIIVLYILNKKEKIISNRNGINNINSFKRTNIKKGDEQIFF